MNIDIDTRLKTDFPDFEGYSIYTESSMMSGTAVIAVTQITKI